MSVVIIGGNECMVCQYQEICKKHGCKAKIFVKEKSGFKTIAEAQAEIVKMKTS